MRVNVSAYGAVGNGSTDDRAAIQAAIDAVSAAGGGVVEFGAGTFICTQNSTLAYCLNVPGKIRLVGESMATTILKQAPGIGVCRLVRLTGDLCEISNLTLDGNKATQSVSEHRHGIFADACTNLILEKVYAKNFTGDGFYVYTNCLRVTFRDCFSTANDRNGLTLGQQATDLAVLGGFYFSNAFTQIDSEPVGTSKVESVRVVGASLDCGAINAVAVTISGTSEVQGRGWSVVGNTINGPVHQVWCDDVTIVGNHGKNACTKPLINYYRKGARLVSVGNVGECTQNTVSWVPGLDAGGAGGIDSPDHAIYACNAIKVTHQDTTGIRAQGVRSLSVIGNSIEGAGITQASSAGVYVRPTNLDVDMRASLVVGNYVRNFGKFGVKYTGNLTAKHLATVATGNVFDDTAGTQTHGVALDESTPLNSLQAISLVGNQLAGGCTTGVVNFPAAPVVIGGMPGAPPITSSDGLLSTSTAPPLVEFTGSPEDTIAAAVGTIGVRRDVAQVWVKTSGAGDDKGWVRVA